MSLYHPLPWFAICALAMLIATAGLAGGFYRERVAASAAGRFREIDGLRGFLALGVFGLHAVRMYLLHAEGAWGTDAPPPFYGLASRAGVSLFFMITAFLFWLRVLRSPDAFDARGFFASRLRRLTPMYAASVLMVLAVAAAASGFAPQVGLAQLARELRPWLSFGFMYAGELNGVADAHYINAVYWTLAYEWSFYLALPLLALFARGPLALAPAAAVLVFGTQAPIVFNFLFGALAAELVQRRTLQGRLDSPWLAPLPLAALALYFAFPGASGFAQAATLFCFFVFVVHGYSLFGLLHTRPAQLLGMVSYSLYLTHCIVLFVTVRAADAVVPVSSLAPAQYWMLAALAAAATVALSMLTYRYVEHPFIAGRGAPRRAALVPGAQAAAP